MDTIISKSVALPLFEGITEVLARISRLTWIDVTIFYCKILIFKNPLENFFFRDIECFSFPMLQRFTISSVVFPGSSTSDVNSISLSFGTSKPNGFM